MKKGRRQEDKEMCMYKKNDKGKSQPDIPRQVRKELFFRAPESRELLRDIFADVRMLCYDTELMSPPARLVWRICRIGGPPSRFRSEPQRRHAVTAA